MERIIGIVRDKFYITVQIVTFEGLKMPPYDFDTIAMRVPGFKVIKYEHKDVSDITKLPLEAN